MIIVFNENDGTEIKRLAPENETEWLSGYNACIELNQLDAFERKLATKAPPPVGAKIRLLANWGGEMGSYYAKGATGNVIESNDGSIRVQLDMPAPGIYDADEWNGEIFWGDGSASDLNLIWWFWREAEILYVAGE